MFVYTVFALAVFSLANGQTTDVEACRNNPGELPINVYIENCVTPPCILPQLQDVVVHMIFRAPRTMKSMTTLATAYLSIGPITLPVPYDLGPDAITCNFLANSYCPVLAGEVVQYTLRMMIELIFPVGTNADLEFRVVDEDGDAIFCLRTRINIVAPVESQSLLARESRNLTAVHLHS